jgi:hypothetical protein
MLEANIFMLIGAMYASFLCCGSMAMSVLLDHYDHQRLAHIIVLVFWLGGGFGLLAYAKTTVNMVRRVSLQFRLGDLTKRLAPSQPTFTTACSMVSLISSVMYITGPRFLLRRAKQSSPHSITKEGAFHIGRFQSQAILQVLVRQSCRSNREQDH